MILHCLPAGFGVPHPRGVGIQWESAVFTRFFIHRPIFASVLSIIIVLGGGIALWFLPIAQYPDITPPTVEVSAIYAGANADVVVKTVAAPSSSK